MMLMVGIRTIYLAGGHDKSVVDSVAEVLADEHQWPCVLACYVASFWLFGLYGF